MLRSLTEREIISQPPLLQPLFESPQIIKSYTSMSLTSWSYPHTNYRFTSQINDVILGLFAFLFILPVTDVVLLINFFKLSYILLGESIASIKNIINK